MEVKSIVAVKSIVGIKSIAAVKSIVGVKSTEAVKSIVAVKVKIAPSMEVKYRTAVYSLANIKKVLQNSTFYYEEVVDFDFSHILVQ